jgi:hypothetical protein
MSNKQISIILIVLGVLILVGSLLADMIGIGREPGLGLIQLGGAVVGLVVALVGLWQLLKHKS